MIHFTVDHSCLFPTSINAFRLIISLDCKPVHHTSNCLSTSSRVQLPQTEAGSFCWFSTAVLALFSLDEALQALECVFVIQVCYSQLTWTCLPKANEMPFMTSVRSAPLDQTLFY